jgi:F-type H+-transporting ATPase subunit gamma
MEMVATSKLKKATDRVYAARPYAEALGGIVRSLYAPELAERFPLLRQPADRRCGGGPVMTANRGFAGAFNVNIVRRRPGSSLRSSEAGGPRWSCTASARRAFGFFRFRGEALYSSGRTSAITRPGGRGVAWLRN